MRATERTDDRTHNWEKAVPAGGAAVQNELQRCFHQHTHALASDDGAEAEVGVPVPAPPPTVTAQQEAAPLESATLI